jgi:hypothetical protein
MDARELPPAAVLYDKAGVHFFDEPAVADLRAIAASAQLHPSR